MNELLQQESNHRLNYHQNNLTFEISQVNLQDGILNQYHYRFIDRHPNNWEPLNAGNQLVLLGLSPGSYPFQFRVCNNNQCRSTEVIEFRILPPFWRSIWFFLLLIILLATIILGYTRLRIRNLIRQQNLRNQISADLHDDIGSSLSSIRFMTEMMTPDPKDLIQEQRLEAIKEEIGQINQNLEEIIWYIKPTSDTLQEIHLKLRRFSWDLLESKGIQLFWEEPKSFGAHKFNSRQKRDYFLFFKEVMNNAAKHSHAKTVRVAITFEDRQFSITITDDGVGFDPDQAVDSNGMETIKTRAARLNGKLAIRSSKAKGATLTLQIPMK
jgi:signal transduction histidine kinase